MDFKIGSIGFNKREFKKRGKDIDLRDFNKENFKKKIFHEYLYEKQVFRELKEEHHLSKKVLKQYILDIDPSVKIHKPREVNIVVDATILVKEKKRQSDV